MNDRRRFRPWTLFADAATGLAIFLLLTGVLTCTFDGRGVRLADAMSQAHAARPTDADVSILPSPPLPLAMVAKPPNHVLRGTDRTSAFVVLAAVFSLLFMANAAFYRHLRSQYSRPRNRRRNS